MVYSFTDPVFLQLHLGVRKQHVLQCIREHCINWYIYTKVTLFKLMPSDNTVPALDCSNVQPVSIGMPLDLIYFANLYD
jgi:hypothetical protein